MDKKRHFDVVIVGAGTAGLTARREVAKNTDNYLLVDSGPLGTTCAREGCMPSKILIEEAQRVHEAKQLARSGKVVEFQVELNGESLMSQLRHQRDQFVSGVLAGMDSWQSNFEAKHAQIIDAHTLDLEGEEVSFTKLIWAAGSRAIIPKQWTAFPDHLVTTEDIFNWTTLPKSLAVVGFGAIGCEMGQALSRLGVDVIGMTRGDSVAGLTDTCLVDYAFKHVFHDLIKNREGGESLSVNSDGLLVIEFKDARYEVEKAFISAGRAPRVLDVGFEKLSNAFIADSKNLDVDAGTLALKHYPHILIAGDASNLRPILHEAADEGTIAGINAGATTLQAFKRRVSMGITFTEPQIAKVGYSFKDLTHRKIDWVVGKVSFEKQGRSRIKKQAKGLLHLYAENGTGRLLGAEMIAPSGEHLAHLLAWSIGQHLTVFDMLKMPFYHPTVEEGVRTALRDAAIQVDKKRAYHDLSPLIDLLLA